MRTLRYAMLEIEHDSPNIRQIDRVFDVGLAQIQERDDNHREGGETEQHENADVQPQEIVVVRAEATIADTIATDVDNAKDCNDQCWRACRTLCGLNQNAITHPSQCSCSR